MTHLHLCRVVLMSANCSGLVFADSTRVESARTENFSALEIPKIQSTALSGLRRHQPPEENYFGVVQLGKPPRRFIPQKGHTIYAPIHDPQGIPRSLR